MPEPINLTSAILRICVERHRQDRLHPRDDWQLTEVKDAWTKEAETLRAANNYREHQGLIRWDDLLMEELAEACSETDPHAQAEELLQLAALAIRAACALTRQEQA